MQAHYARGADHRGRPTPGRAARDTALCVDETAFVLITLGVPAFAWVALARSDVDDGDKWGPIAAVVIWGALAWLLGSKVLDEVKVPFGAQEYVSSPSSPEELAAVVVALYFLGFGLLKVAIAIALGVGAGLYAAHGQRRP